MYRCFITIIAAACMVAVSTQICAVEYGGKAPQLSTKTLAGKTFDLGEAVKAGPVFVSFWGTWNPASKEQFLLVSKLAGQWQSKGVKFISVAIKDKRADVAQFIKKHKPAQQVALDQKDKIFKTWGLSSIPASYLIGKNGIVVGFYDQFEPQDVQALNAEIGRALRAYK